MTGQQSKFGLQAAVSEPLLYGTLAFYMRILEDIFIFYYLNIFILYFLFPPTLFIVLEANYYTVL